jgi:hypothetical protein
LYAQRKWLQIPGFFLSTISAIAKNTGQIFTSFWKNAAYIYTMVLMEESCDSNLNICLDLSSVIINGNVYHRLLDFRNV